jgi:hypothetical protein
MADQTCRLCGDIAVPQFIKRVLGKYDVEFARCRGCESLQTSPPFWLDEAYADQRRFYDTGAVARNQHLQAVVFFVARALGFKTPRVLDWGGGDGLLVRMLRDSGMDARHYDRYARNVYAAGFDDSLGQSYDIVTAFEVWEHMDDPATTVRAIFERKPVAHVLTTALYQNQGADWQYLWAETGRHVFFFSRRAMRRIADQYGYHVIHAGSVTIFYACPLSAIRRRVLTWVLWPPLRRLLHTAYIWYPKRSLADADRAAVMRERARIA